MKMNDHDGLNALGTVYLVASLIGAAGLLLSACDQWNTASNPRAWNVDRDALEAAASYNLVAAIAVGFSGFLVRGVLNWMVGVYRALAKLNGIADEGNARPVPPTSNLPEE